MAEQQDRNSKTRSLQHQLPPTAPQPWGHWRQQEQRHSPAGSAGGSAAGSMPATPNAASPTATPPATHTRSAAAIQRFAAALDAAGLADPAVRALAGQFSSSNPGNASVAATSSTPGSAKSSGGGAAPSIRSINANGLSTVPSVANSTASCSSLVSPEVQRFAADVSAAGLANITFMAIAASAPEDGTAANNNNNSSSSSSSKYGCPTANMNPALLTGGSTTSNPIRAVGSGQLTGYSAIGTLAPMRSSDYGTLPHSGWCDSNKSSELGDGADNPFSWYGKWPGMTKPPAAACAGAAAGAAAGAVAAFKEDPSEYASRGGTDSRFWLKHSVEQEHDLRSYGSSNSCLSLVGAAEHMQPVLLEGLSKRPTSMYQSVDPGSAWSRQDSGLPGSAAELQQHLAAVAVREGPGLDAAGDGSAERSSAAGAAIVAAIGGLKKMFGFAGRRSVGSIPALQEPLEVEKAISIGHKHSSMDSSATNKAISIMHKCSSIDNPAFITDDVISSSSQQYHEGISCPLLLEKGLRYRVSTASSLSPAAAAEIGSNGGLAGHQLSNGSVGVSHRQTPLGSKDHSGSLHSSLRSAPDAGNAADPPSDSAPWRLKPALWWTTAPATAAPAPPPAAAASSVRSKGGSRGSSSKRSDSSSSGSSSDGGKQAAGRRKRMSLILLLSLLVVMTAAGMGVGVYFGLIRQTPAENAKDQSAAATAAQSVGGFENFGVPDAAVLSGPVPPLNFQVVLAVPAVSADQGCRTWFSSDERLQQYKAIFSASYTAALKQPVLQSSISAITCGGTLMYTASNSGAVTAETAGGAGNEATSSAAAARPARTLLVHADVLTGANAHSSMKSSRSLLQQQQQQQRKNVLAPVEIVTRFSMPAPATHTDRARIAETVVTGSSAILSGPMSEFFEVPSALMNFVPWSSNTHSNEAGAPQPRTAVPVIRPSLSYSEAPTCLFPLTRSNSMADDQGRFWSLMDGKECVFRPAAAAIPRPVAKSVSWQDAPACIEQPNESNSVADDNGRLWGWQTGASCAFKNDSLAPIAIANAAARVAAGGPGDAPGMLSVVWEAASSCSFSPNRANAVPDTYGRLWSWENGKSCVFRWQSLPTRRM